MKEEEAEETAGTETGASAGAVTIETVSVVTAKEQKKESARTVLSGEKVKEAVSGEQIRAEDQREKKKTKRFAVNLFQAKILQLLQRKIRKNKFRG